MTQCAPSQRAGATCASLNPGPGFISSWGSPWIFNVTLVFSLSRNPHPANLRWVRDGSPWPTNWTQLEKQLLACSLPEEIQQSQNIPSITSSSPHTWYLTTWHDVVSSRHCESFTNSAVQSLCLIFLLLKKWFKSCRGQTGLLRFSQHVVGSLKGARRKENVDLFPHPGDDKSAVTSDDLLLLQ